MTFTQQFNELDVASKPEFAATERLRRIQEDLDSYIAIPVALPIMSRMVAQPVNFTLGWAIGVPGQIKDDEGKPARTALTLGMPNEEVAEDMCFLLNWARAQRMSDESYAMLMPALENGGDQDDTRTRLLDSKNSS